MQIVVVLELVLDVDVEVDAVVEVDVEVDEVGEIVVVLAGADPPKETPLNLVLSVPIFAYEVGEPHPGTVQYPSHTYAVSGWPTATLAVGMSPAMVFAKSTVAVWPGVSRPIESMLAASGDVKFSGRPPAPVPSDVDATNTQLP